MRDRYIDLFDAYALLTAGDGDDSRDNNFCVGVLLVLREAFYGEARRCRKDTAGDQG